jgi:hypothetical protein
VVLEEKGKKPNKKKKKKKLTWYRTSAIFQIWHSILPLFTFRETLSSAATTPTMRIHARKRENNERSEQCILHVSASRAYPMMWCGVFFLSHIDCAYSGKPLLIYTLALAVLSLPDLARVMAACLWPFRDGKPCWHTCLEHTFHVGLKWPYFLVTPTNFWKPFEKGAHLTQPN